MDDAHATASIAAQPLDTAQPRTTAQPLNTAQPREPQATTAASTRRTAAGRGIRDMRLWLGAYAVALALIAFWPVPVDSGAGPFLRAITAAVPWLTYDLIEFSANVLLFVPLGALLALVIPRRRMLVLPVALVSTIIIETGQALLLSARTPSLRDIVANFSGAAVGLLIVWLLERRRAKTAARPS